jgi:hypothetical protein
MNAAEIKLLKEFRESTTNYVCTMDCVPRLPGDVGWARAALPALKTFATRKAQKSEALNDGTVTKWLFRSQIVPGMVDEFVKKIESMLLDRYFHLCQIVRFKPSVADDGSMRLDRIPTCGGEAYLAEAWDESFAKGFLEWPLECHFALPERVVEQPKAEARELTEEAVKALKAKFHTRVIVMGAMGGGKSSVINALCSGDVSHEQMCRGGVAQVSNRAIGVTKGSNSFVAGGGIFVTDTMGTDDNDKLEESGPKMIADTKLLFRNADDGDVGYTHLILVIKQGRISNAGLRALSIVKNVLPEEAWSNVMLYNSYAEDNTEVSEWFDECRQLANDGDTKAKKLMEVKALLDAHTWVPAASRIAQISP